MLLLLAAMFLANDGFFDGAGSTLVLVKNHEVRVLSEVLEISALDPPACYDMRWHDQDIRRLGVQPNADAFAVPGKK